MMWYEYLNLQMQRYLLVKYKFLTQASYLSEMFIFKFKILI